MANVRRDRHAAGARVPVAGPVRVALERVGAARPAALLGELPKPGRSVLALSKGAVSFLAVLEWALDALGAADVTIATWTIGSSEIEAVGRLCSSDRIRGLRLLVDPSFVARQPEYAAALRRRFGPDVIRFANCHAKIAVLTPANGTAAVLVLSSANLNENKRLEFFHVVRGNGPARDVAAVLGEWFERPADEDVAKAFDAWRADSGDRYHEPGVMGRDLSRLGVTFSG